MTKVLLDKCVHSKKHRSIVLTARVGLTRSISILSSHRIWQDSNKQSNSHSIFTLTALQSNKQLVWQKELLNLTSSWWIWNHSVLHIYYKWSCILQLLLLSCEILIIPLVGKPLFPSLSRPQYATMKWNDNTHICSIFLYLLVQLISLLFPFCSW